MDWAESQDLIDIFLAEIDERTTRLAAGAASFASGSIGDIDLEVMIRDAHTLKGSSHMLGKLELGSAAAVLERAWKYVATERPEQVQPLAGGMRTTTRLLAEAARQPSRRDDLTRASVEVSQLLDMMGAAGTKSAPAREQSGDGPAKQNATDETEDGDDEPSHAPADVTLGGLLGSVQDELSGAVTRVDTSDLYRLINRAVEIGLDTEALADLTHVAFEGADPVKLLAAWRDQLERLSADVSELQSWAVSLANVPLAEAVETYPQFVRFLSRRLGREVRFEANGSNLMVDRQIVDLVREPLRHLIVNAVDHGIELASDRIAQGKHAAGLVRLDARVMEDRLVISVTDDGRGIEWDAVMKAAARRGLGTHRSELESHLFRPGFSTVTQPNDFSGTGEGLALVADAADRVGGSVSIDSSEGKGTVVRMELPVSLVLQNVVIVASGDQFFGIAEPAVDGAVSLETSTVRFGTVGRELVYDGEPIPLVSFARAMGLHENQVETDALVLNTRSGKVAVSVHEIIDSRRVAVKSLGPILDGADHLTGAAFLGGGEVLVVVDHNYLGAEARRPEAQRGTRPRVLVVDDSAGVRQLIAATLRGRGFDVEVSSNAREAVYEMAKSRYDALVIDYSMPRSNGVELVRALRHAGVLQPIVMVSGVADENDKAAAWEAGVDAYLDKYDLRRGALATSIRRLLEEGNGRTMS